LENLEKDLSNKLSTFLDEVNKIYEIKFAYVFGSQAKGEAREDSDIDIAIFFINNYSKLEEALVRGNIIEDGKKFFTKDIDIISLNSCSLLIKHEVIHDGIVIVDSEDRAEFESLSLREYFDFKYYADIYDNKIIESIKDGNYFGG
jgi:uncharacterized protein